MHWSIRFRPKVARAGALPGEVLQAKFTAILEDHLEPYLENSTAAAVSRWFHQAALDSWPHQERDQEPYETLPMACGFHATERAGRQPR